VPAARPALESESIDWAERRYDLPGRTGYRLRRSPVDKKAKTPKKPKQNKAKTAK
jgi:hypothetical protein